MIKNKTSIRNKIFFVLLTLSLFSSLFVGGIALYSMKEIEQSAIDIMIDKNQNMLQVIAHKQSAMTHEILSRTEQSITIIAESLIWEKGKNNDVIFRSLESLKNHDPYIYNTYIATTDGKFTSFSKDKADNLDKNFNPLERSWYQKAINSKSLVWSDVYPDASISGKLMITCSKVIYDTQGEIAGVIGFDLTTEEVSNNIINTEIGDMGYAFLIDSYGNIIARPEINSSNSQWDEIFTIPIGGNLHQVKNSEFQAILNEMIGSKVGFLEWERKMEGNKFIAFNTFSSMNLTLGVVSSRAAIEDAAESVFIEKIKEVSIYFIAILIVIMFLAIIIGINSSKIISRPIEILNDGVRKIGAGNLDYIIEIKTGNELEQLAGEFNKMSSNLRQHMRDLELTTKQKQQIESELNIASRIQRDMLPMIFPAFPDNKELDIYASMLAAKQVGGDFYDFFLINPDKLCFVIGDVSGKGIPASLFMVISKTLIKNEAMSNISPAEVLYNVNNTLNNGNEEMMFVTVLLCMMELSTGNIEFANAGHNPPLLMKNNNQDVDYLHLNKSKILGVFPDAPYTNQNITLNPQDTLVLYTDGVTEAMDPDNNQFTENKLHETLLNLQGFSVEKIEEGIQHAVKGFVKDAEQSDDITLLIVQYYGK